MFVVMFCMILNVIWGLRSMVKSLWLCTLMKLGDMVSFVALSLVLFCLGMILIVVMCFLCIFMSACALGVFVLL